jgi:hypothetical protein
VSLLILDDQLDVSELLPDLERWTTAQRLGRLRPGERVLDDRVPEVLRTLRQPTFVTIDQDFWDASCCQPAYCILYFALRDNQQGLIPGLLRALLQRPAFRTRGVRMGKVVRVSAVRIDYWQFPQRQLHRIAWQGASRRRR